MHNIIIAILLTVLTIPKSTYYTYKTISFVLSICLLCSIFMGCNEKHANRNVERFFSCYWKSVFGAFRFEKHQLDSLHVNTIYLKFFDVDWDKDKQHPIPKATVRVIDSAYLNQKKIKIIPTVFITNECIQKVDSAEIGLLADKIVSLIKNIASNELIAQPVSEVQLIAIGAHLQKINIFLYWPSLKNWAYPLCVPP